MTEEWQKIGYGNSVENFGKIHVPGYALGFNRWKDPFIQRNKQKFSSFASNEKKLNH
jgi:hypothetical protein